MLKPSIAGTYQKIVTNSGTFPVIVPNTTMDGDGLYVSYNDRDTAIFGSDTTALVWGQMEKFYVLNGDHRAAYAQLMDRGFEACLGYFKANLMLINKYSEKIAVKVP